MNTYEIHKYNKIWVLTCRTPSGRIYTVSISDSETLVQNTKLKMENQNALEVCTSQ